MVVLFHVILIFYPALFYNGETNYATHGAEVLGGFYGNPFLGFLNGTFAVAIFFVLSGFVLSVSFFHKKQQSIINRMALKRYIRLMLPALASVLLVWLVLSIGVQSVTKDVVEPITHSGWLSRQWDIIPSLTDALYQGLYGAFFTKSLEYNPVLWTISIELIGSFLVFSLLTLVGLNKRRYWVYLLLYIFLATTWYGAFIIGVVLADIYANKGFGGLNSRLVALGMVAGIFLGGYPSGGVEGTLYEYVKLGVMPNGLNRIFFLTIAAALVVLATLALKSVANFFSSRLIGGLGKYTYALYLTHMPVIFTVTTGVFLLLFTTYDMSYAKAALISAVATVPALILVTYLFERYIDAPSIRLSSRFADWIAERNGNNGA